MIKTTLAAALLVAGFTGAAQAGEHRFSDTDRAFMGYYERQPERAPALAPAHQVPRSYQERFGTFSAANMARNLGF